MSYQLERLKQGYDLFECEGMLEIQRLDDPESIQTEAGVQVERHHATDDDAVQFVTEQARKGDPVAQDAIERHGSVADA